VSVATLATTFGLALVPMLLLWLLSLRLRDVSIVDIWWGPGFAWIGLASLWVAPGAPAARGVLALVLVALWGGRLGGYLLWRNWGSEEDYRYRAMRRRHGARFAWISLFTVFGLQGALQWIVSLPVQAAILSGGAGDLDGFALAGAALFAVGLFFESVGDLQLARFKADAANQGQVMDRGLWRYTRHPNYFGDCVVWWGLFLVACGAPDGVWTAIGPIVMTIFLMRVSGVTLLERSLVKRKPGYQDYAERTSAFFPLPPRR
jgi:steroid 5-alpha reductase family enzyme